MLSDETAMEYAVRLVLAMMRSASTEKIRPIAWWSRAKSALETAAATADDLPRMVSEMGRKLQIDSPNSETSKEICSLTSAICGDFETVRRLCESQSLYVVAIAQGQRAAIKAERERKARMPDLTEPPLSSADLTDTGDLL